MFIREVRAVKELSGHFNGFGHSLFYDGPWGFKQELDNRLRLMRKFEKVRLAVLND